MPKKLDNELESYKRKIGRENFKNLYRRVYAKTHSNKRFSGRKYKNSPEKLAAIKEKYKNGVSKEFINEMLGIKDMKENERSNRVYTSQIPR